MRVKARKHMYTILSPNNESHTYSLTGTRSGSCVGSRRSLMIYTVELVDDDPFVVESLLIEGQGRAGLNGIEFNVSRIT